MRSLSLSGWGNPGPSIPADETLDFIQTTSANRGFDNAAAPQTIRRSMRANLKAHSQKLGASFDRQVRRAAGQV
jgi:hypothetical protein